MGTVWYSSASWLQSWEGEAQSRDKRDEAVCWSCPTPAGAEDVEFPGLLREVSHRTHFSNGDVDGNAQCPCRKWSSEKNGKKQCFSAGPLHYGNPDPDLQMSLFSDYLTLLLRLDIMAFIMAFIIQS